MLIVVLFLLLQADPEQILYLSTVGFSDVYLCGFWRKTVYNSCNKPVFHQRNWYFLHFRPSLDDGGAGCWVIEEGSVTPARGVIARSRTDRLSREWESKPEPELADAVSVNLAGNQVSVKGTELCNNTRGMRLDGLYERTATPNVYQKAKKGDKARYVFFNNKEKRWMVSTARNPSQPHLLQSGGSGSELSNSHGWFSIPAKWKTQPDVQITQLTEPAAKELWPDYFTEAANGEGTEDLPLADLLAWDECPQDVMLSSNITQAVHVLSLEPQLLERRMHPALYQLLGSRGVDLGENFLSSSSKHAAILSALTGIQRTPQAAAKLLGDHYVLTGDSALKILAIFTRVCSGVPVVVSDPFTLFYLRSFGGFAR